MIICKLVNCIYSFPCFHSGDLMVVFAKNPCSNACFEYKNCIVFHSEPHSLMHASVSQLFPLNSELTLVLIMKCQDYDNILLRSDEKKTLFYCFKIMHAMQFEKVFSSTFAQLFNETIEL